MGKLPSRPSPDRRPPQAHAHWAIAPAPRRAPLHTGGRYSAIARTMEVEADALLRNGATGLAGESVAMAWPVP